MKGINLYDTDKNQKLITNDRDSNDQIPSRLIIYTWNLRVNLEHFVPRFCSGLLILPWAAIQS